MAPVRIVVDRLSLELELAMEISAAVVSMLQVCRCSIHSMVVRRWSSMDGFDGSRFGF